MKKYNYEEFKEDEHIVKNWTPIKVKVDNNYKFIKTNILFKFISNILCIPIFIILYILNKVVWGYKIERKIKFKGGFVSISNHIHMMDCTMNALCYYPRRAYFPALQDTFGMPVVRHLIRLLYAFPIPKDKQYMDKFYKEVNSLLNNNGILHMYPEGSLWPYYEEIRNFKYGAFKIAVDANKPIVPIKFVFREPKGIYKLYKRNKCIHTYMFDPIYPNNKLEYKDRIEDLRSRTINIMNKEI